jgi:hypothetical protein
MLVDELGYVESSEGITLYLKGEITLSKKMDVESAKFLTMVAATVFEREIDDKEEACQKQEENQAG